MIATWAVKSMLRERGVYVASAAGIAAALLIVMLLEGMFAGEAERIVAYVERAGADVWVMQAGVSNMHMASSQMHRELARRVESVPGVASVTPILYASTFLNAGGRQWYSYVVGLRARDDRGKPWAMVAGTDHPARGEAIIPDVLATRAAIGIGDEITLLGRRFRVAGISAGTYSMANSITFVDYADLAELLSAPQAASYLLVESASTASPDVVAERIRQSMPELNAMSREALAASDRRMAMQMGVDIIRVMTWVGSLLAGLIVAFASYTATVRRSRELGVAKALGVSNRSLYYAVLLQTVLVCGLGYVVALALAIGVRPLVQALVPEVALFYPPALAMRLAAAAAAVALAAAWVPARRIAHVDPATVFRA